MKDPAPFLLLSLLFFSALVAAKDVTFNNTFSAECTADAPCWLWEPSLWEGNLSPEQNDTVNIQVEENTHIFINQSFDFTNLVLWGPLNFTVAAGNINVQNVSLNASYLEIRTGAQIISLQDTSVRDGARINLNGGAYGQDGFGFYLHSTCNITIAPRSYLGLHADSSFIFGDLFISATAMFFSTGGVLHLFNQDLVFPITPTIYAAVIINSNIVFQQGIRNTNESLHLFSSSVTIYGAPTGANTYNNVLVDDASSLYLRQIPNCVLNTPNITGAFYISSSTVALTAPISSPKSVVIGGQVNITSNVVLIDYTEFTVGDFGEPASINITATEVVYWVNNLVIPQGYIFTPHFVCYDRYATMTGDITVQSAIDIEECTLNITGHIRVGYDQQWDVSPNSYTQLHGVNFTASVLSIGPNGTLEIQSSMMHSDLFLHSNSSLHHYYTDFTGDIFSNGFIPIRRFPLYVIGNYTQGPHGILNVGDMDLLNRTTGYLNIIGAANLDGTIQYEVATAPENNKKMQLPILESTQGITGKFATEPLNVGTENVNHKAAILYSDLNVYLVFGEDTKNAGSLWWIWLIIAFAIVAVLVLIFLLYRSYASKRKDYTPVRN